MHQAAVREPGTSAVGPVPRPSGAAPLIVFVSDHGGLI